VTLKVIKRRALAPLAGTPPLTDSLVYF